MLDSDDFEKQLDALEESKRSKGKGRKLKKDNKRGKGDGDWIRPLKVIVQVLK
jgi:hypothetical protein